ncbi:hypothetical protein B0H16DRAFT_1457488 [Mycena metata]|uniref:Uncharacterized protein n=1 Tax=Mycena metata TaxID=1033252 RepID=A0AAD7NFP3_9AGAR|nr:hypothetical protein B0H16DRAFT_1457488 [Mycena metata]
MGGVLDHPSVEETERFDLQKDHPSVEETERFDLQKGQLCGDERGTFRRSFLRGNVGDMLEGPSVKETERFDLQMGRIHRISKNGHICPTSAQGSSAAMNAGLFGVNSCIGTLGGC